MGSFMITNTKYHFSMIRTNKVQTIQIQHDVSLPRPKPSSNDLMSCTKGIFMFHNDASAIATSHRVWIPDYVNNKVLGIVRGPDAGLEVAFSKHLLIEVKPE